MRGQKPADTDVRAGCFSGSTHPGRGFGQERVPLPPRAAACFNIWWSRVKINTLNLSRVSRQMTVNVSAHCVAFAWWLYCAKAVRQVWGCNQLGGHAGARPTRGAGDAEPAACQAQARPLQVTNTQNNSNKQLKMYRHRPLIDQRNSTGNRWRFWTFHFAVNTYSMHRT